MELISPGQAWQDALGRPILNTVIPFYRRYPWRSPISIFFMHHRGLYLPAEKVFYNRIPKAANSTMVKLMLTLTELGEGDGHTNYKRILPSHVRMPLSEVQALASGTYTRITVVRNPYDRVLSAYKEKILRRRRQLSRFASALGASDGQIPSFEAFCRFIDSGGLHRDAHWAPQSDLMLLPLEDYDVIGRVESLSVDIGRIFAALGKPTPSVIPKVNRTERTRTGLSHYTAESMDIVRRLYKRDFELFGYDPDNLPGSTQGV